MPSSQLQRRRRTLVNSGAILSLILHRFSTTVNKVVPRDGEVSDERRKEEHRSNNDRPGCVYCAPQKTRLSVCEEHDEALLASPFQQFILHPGSMGTMGTGSGLIYSRWKARRGPRGSRGMFQVSPATKTMESRGWRSGGRLALY